MAFGRRRRPRTDVASAEQPPTNLGPVVDDAVRAATERLRPSGEDADYDLVRDEFDVLHYFLQAPRMVARPNVDAVRSFLREGPRVRRSPHVNFSVPAYLERHPERGTDPDASPYLAWLREGRAAGEIGDPARGLEEIAHVLGQTPGELAGHLADLRSDLQQRLRHGRLGEMFAKAVAIDPLVGDAWAETTRPKIPPLPAALVAHQVAAVHRCHEEAGFHPARVLLVVDGPGTALADAVLARLAGKVDAADVVVLSTAADGPGPAKPADGPRHVGFAAAVEALEASAAQQVLAEVVRSFGAEVVLGLHSQLLLDTLTPFGKALHASERLFLAFPALGTGPLGNPTGAALRYFYRHLDVVEGFLAEDPDVVDTLADLYQLPAEVRSRLHLLDEDLPALLLGGEPR